MIIEDRTEWYLDLDLVGHSSEARIALVSPVSIEDEDLDPSIEVEWIGLVCARGTNGACVKGYPARIH